MAKILPRPGGQGNDKNASRQKSTEDVPRNVPGLPIPCRGTVHDMGRSISHKGIQSAGREKAEQSRCPRNLSLSGGVILCANALSRTAVPRLGHRLGGHRPSHGSLEVAGPGVPRPHRGIQTTAHCQPHRRRYPKGEQGRIAEGFVEPVHFIVQRGRRGHLWEFWRRFIGAP